MAYKWQPIVRNPVDLPVLQRAMGRLIRMSLDTESTRQFGLANTFYRLVEAMDSTNYGDDIAGYGYVTHSAADAVFALENGGSYFVANEMTTMLHRVARNVPDEITFHPRIFPQEMGFLYLEEPLLYNSMAIVAWSWMVDWISLKDLENSFQESIDEGEVEGIDQDHNSGADAVLALIDEGAVVRGKGDNEEIGAIAMTFWVDASHEDDSYFRGTPELNDPAAVEAEEAEGMGYNDIQATVESGWYGVNQFKMAPLPIHHTWFPGGVRIDNSKYGVFPAGVKRVYIDRVNNRVGREITYNFGDQSLDLWKFVIATFEMLNSRIVMQQSPNRAQQKQLHRAKFNEKFRVIRLRKIIRPSQKPDPNDTVNHIDYRYMVPPNWQRYHTNQGVIWKMRDWYIAGPDDAPLLDRDTVYQLDR